MVATFEQLRTKNLKTFDELRKKPEPSGYGMIAIPRKKLPGAWEYDKQLEQLFDQDLDSLVPMNIKYDFGRIVGMTEKPDDTKDRMKNSLYYSIIFGKPPEIIYNVLDKLNEIALGVKLPASTAWGRIKQRYQGGKKQVQSMDYGFDLLKRTWHNWEAYEESIKAIEKLQSGIPDDVRKDFRGFFEKTFGAAAEQMPMLWETIKEAPVGAMVGGFTGAALAVIGGLALPTPEEALTVPTATIKGAVIGAGVRGAVRIGQLEAGGMFLEMAMMEDIQGKRIDPKIAAVASYAVGTINGAIEIGEWAVLLSTFGIGTKIFEKSAAKVTSKLFAEGTLKKIVAKNILKFGGALTAETLQEIEQETSNIVFGELAKELNNARKGTDFKRITAEDLKERYKEVTIESLRAFGVILTPGTMVSTAIDIATKKPEVTKPTAKVKPTEVKVPPTEAIPAPEKPAEAITPEKPVEVATKKIGDAQRVSGIDAIVAKTQRIDGVDYELYNAAKLKDKRGIVRVFDVESGETVTVRTYPTYDQAEAEYNKAIKVAKPEAVEVAAEPAKIEKKAEPIIKEEKNLLRAMGYSVPEILKMDRTAARKLIEKPLISKEKFTPPEVQKEIKTQVPETSAETQDATNLLEGYWREFDERELEINVAATKNQEAITKALGKKQYLLETDIETSKMSQAMMLYIDLKEHPSGHQFAEELSKLQKEIYELSKKLPTQIQKIADSIIEQNREFGAMAVDKEVIANARENYIAHLWQKPKREEVYRALFRQKTVRAKARTLEGGIMEGWAKGKTLRVKDVTLAAQIAQSQINQALVGKELLKLGKKWGLLSHKQPEGWVRVEHPGFTTWRHAGTVEVEKGVIKEGQWVRPADRKNLGKVTMVKGDRTMVHFRNKETGLEETKEFPIDQLKIVRSYGKNFFITEEGELMERLPVYAEPELGKKLNNVFSPSALYKIPGIETISRYNAQIKSTILFTSLYHHQAFLRSYAFGSRGLNPKTAYEKGRQSIMNMTPEVRLLVRNGLTIGRIQDYDPRMIEGEQTIWGRAMTHTKPTEAIREKLVALRKGQERFLFNKMGPALKIQAGILELKAELKRNQAELESGEITVDEIAAAVANLMNNDFGGLHLGRMGRSQTAQHLFRLLALAPDWTESNIRSAVQAFAKGETGYLHRMFWGRIAIKGLGATILFNLLLSAFDDDDFVERYKKAWETGRLRWLDIDITPIYEAMGGTDDKRKYFSLLGHFRDPVKFTVHPFISAKHKGSVVSRIMLDMMIGQDWAGRQFTTIGELLGITEDGKNSGRLVKYSRSGAKPIEPAQVPSYALYQVRSAMPIPMQNLIAFLGGEMDAFDAITKSLGLMTATTYPERKKKSRKITR